MSFTRQQASRCIHGALGVAVCLVAWMVGGGAQADVLVTRDGESLSGSLSRVVDGILVFRTSLQGQIMVPVSEIRSLQTEGRWIVRVGGGDLQIGRFARDGIIPDGSVGGPESVLPLDFEHIESAKQAPPLPDRSRAAWNQDEGWTQRSATGIQSHTGSDDTLAPFFLWEAQHRSDEQKLELRLRLDVSDGEDVGNLSQGELEWVPREFTTWSPYLRLGVDRDTYDALEWRTGLTVGVRYTFSSESDQSYFAFLGLASHYGQWRGYHPNERWYSEKQDEEGGAVGIELGVALERPFLEQGALESRLRVGPGTAGDSDFRAQAESILTYPVTARLHLRFDVSLSYEETPILNTLSSWDTRLGAGVQFQF